MVVDIFIFQLLSSNSINHTDIDVLFNCELDEMPQYLMECIISSTTFAQDSSTNKYIFAMAATKVCNYSSFPGWTSRGVRNRSTYVGRGVVAHLGK